MAVGIADASTWSIPEIDTSPYAVSRFVAAGKLPGEWPTVFMGRLLDETLYSTSRIPFHALGGESAMAFFDHRLAQALLRPPIVSEPNRTVFSSDIAASLQAAAPATLKQQIIVTVSPSIRPPRTKDGLGRVSAAQLMWMEACRATQSDEDG